ncbi:hypothetical protein [Novosphingobium terrae]|uniref:hypothetical protein n=1 Tax=Novosphingobium terrae TaxID=2726189 RepID=UPI00197E1224|nr:hypothetical protein [Novosphingobium terrae]
MEERDKDHAASQKREGPLGDVIPPTTEDRDTRTGGAQPAEQVDDRPNFSQVKPEDYPLDERARIKPDGNP